MNIKIGVGGEGYGGGGGMLIMITVKFVRFMLALDKGMSG